MGTKRATPKVVKGLRDLNDLSKLLTGKPLAYIVERAVNIFGGDILEKVAVAKEPEDPLAPCYRTLGVHPDAAEFIVKAAFRASAREYHPDTGTKPDPARFQAMTEAYNAIQKARKPA